MRFVSILGIIAVTVLCVAPVARAIEKNFCPANMTGTAPAPEAKKACPVAKVKSSEPGFWEREARRSGLASTGDNFKNNVGGFFSVPDWFKKQEDAYKARNSGTDSR